ncbi:hypothetical protein [Paenibacillus fonticola]
MLAKFEQQGFIDKIRSEVDGRKMIFNGKRHKRLCAA